ncbi:MAG TPA: hypothetical protein VKD22_01705 [Ramlibacter sp.]|nr:hypothetical protein [Ramlibacter sp.]
MAFHADQLWSEVVWAQVNQIVDQTPEAIEDVRDAHVRARVHAFRRAHPFVRAAMGGLLYKVRRARPLASDVQLLAALEGACANGRAPVLAELYSCARTKEEREECLYLSVVSGDRDCVQILLNSDADPESVIPRGADGPVSLVAAAKVNGHEHLLPILHGAIRNKK